MHTLQGEEEAVDAEQAEQQLRRLRHYSLFEFRLADLARRAVGFGVMQFLEYRPKGRDHLVKHEADQQVYAQCREELDHHRRRSTWARLCVQSKRAVPAGVRASSCRMSGAAKADASVPNHPDGGSSEQ